MNRCSLCPGDHHCVPASGPIGSRIIFIGEGPGWEEDKALQPFVGKTGREVNEHYMPLCGLRRDNYRFTNAMACMPKGQAGKLDMKRSADRELVETCASTHLYPELQCNHYSLIVPMGAFACHVIDPTISLDLHHGIPRETAWGTVFPMWHPSGGIHEPKKMLHIRNDWVRLRKFLAGKLNIAEDPYAGIEVYREIGCAEEISESLRGLRSWPLANDTESTRMGEPYCLTYSIEPGTGYLIRAGRGDLLRVFQSHIETWDGPLLWHNWLYDRKVVTQMGLKYPDKKVVDTMVKAFHLGNLPQGLKALAYRELGMTMEDFDDVVSPYSRPLVVQYYHDAMTQIDWVKPPAQQVRESDGTWKTYQPQSMRTKFKRFFTDYMKSPTKDVFSTWDNWEEQQEEIETRMEKPWPGKCITHVPFDKVLHYACRDADATLRLWPIIKWMESQVRHTVQENWGDRAA